MTEQIKCKQLFLIILISLFTTLIHAGTTGKLAGKISDIEGNPIPFANIVLRQNGVNVAGGASRENGTFFIINIPPGIHEMQITHEVYHPAKVTGLIIPLDETSVQNVELVRSSVKIEGFEGFIVTKATNLKDNIMSLDEFDHDSPQSIDEAISLVAGVESNNGEIHVRGGRSNKVAYKDDGLSGSDPIDGASSLQIDMDAVQVMGVQTGGSTAGEHFRQKKAKNHNVDKRHLGSGTTMSLDELDHDSPQSIDDTITVVAGVKDKNDEIQVRGKRSNPEVVCKSEFSDVPKNAKDCGTFKGRVTDETGSALPYVSISLASYLISDVIVLIHTNELGNYELDKIPPGTYKIFYSSNSYEKYVIDTLEIKKGENKIFDVIMKKIDE